jgi:hypothetical protein
VKEALYDDPALNEKLVDDFVFAKHTNSVNEVSSRVVKPFKVSAAKVIVGAPITGELTPAK